MKCTLSLNLNSVYNYSSYFCNHRKNLFSATASEVLLEVDNDSIYLKHIISFESVCGYVCVCRRAQRR